MDLGNGELLRTGLNSLNQAVHPTQGLAWTDGSRVVLTDLQFHGGEATFGDSQVIGRFEYVCGVSWNPVSTAHTLPLLAVQHRKHVSVWQLWPSTSGSSKWQMYQASEIRESLPVLPQGCVWHPKDTVLTVLTARDVSIFPDVHSSGSRVSVSAEGRIYCACWTLDGRRLVVAVDDSLRSYIWDSAQKSVHSCSLCPVFPVSCSVRSIAATADSQVAVATELPLAKLCSLNASEAFDGPANGEDGGVHTPSVSEAPPVGEEAAASEMGAGVADSPFSAPLDLTHIHFSQSQAEESSLICLRKKDYLTGTGQDSSHLVLVTFEKAVTMTKKVAVPGILVPDLIAFNLTAQLVAVASNMCNIILIFSVTSSAMPNIQQIQLESNERPKGMCFLTNRLLLIAVGKQKPTETAFLPSSESDQYMVHLIVRKVSLGRESPGASPQSQRANCTLSELESKAEREKLVESLSLGSSPLSQGLLLTANCSTQSEKSGRALIQELKSPFPPLCRDSAVQETLHRPSGLWTAGSRPSSTPDHTSTPEPKVPQRENLQKEKETCPLSGELAILSRHLVGMQQHLLELMDFLHKEKRFSPVYPLSQEPPYIHLIYQKPPSFCPAEKRAVLLCDGKLRLSTIQQMFGLSLVEMLHDSHWILLCADSQGFIPLTFTAAQTVVVRDGSCWGAQASTQPFSPIPEAARIQCNGSQRPCFRSQEVRASPSKTSIRRRK
ncbi:WD repeat and coiled-coil-containing protein isoform X1 [Meriones unguiculatus]|uniref:WD repeat and coiled-coil-containing protein isoform X1 n=2 Tax=Meriones unguiculatus TaxID=10047 RepID=UPI000B4F5A49|nr:WD repeat and coiled-coil-containing protein isoform X1 [Meriones unguiculatus]XP_060221467.1 WD repeat and coiled-coil-containing protein isoform X1 [Meriones unguiculatus]XP_060221470.1 WD repeat and coiled-coil-containing protein isoform X1 [Meriones unguiculatus]XP_060221480.1 WD repeat and coiled-coil-containing protein isoform X1 [Meriones unguiculatus]